MKLALSHFVIAHDFCVGVCVHTKYGDVWYDSVYHKLTVQLWREGPVGFQGGVGERVGGGCDMRISHLHGWFRELALSRTARSDLHNICSFSLTLWCFKVILPAHHTTQRGLQLFPLSLSASVSSLYTQPVTSRCCRHFLFIFCAVLSFSQPMLSSSFKKELSTA